MSLRFEKKGKGKGKKMAKRISFCLSENGKVPEEFRIFCVVPIYKGREIVPDGRLRLCIDYRKVNEMTVKDRFPFLCFKNGGGKW